MRKHLPNSALPGIFGAAGIILLVLSLTSAGYAGEPARVTELLSKPLEGIPGKEGTMIIVEYPPGASDPIHRHNASAFVYVLEGVVEMQMEGGQKVTLHPGQTFYEDPAGIHLVGRNVSDRDPAKFIVFLVKNQGAPLLVPVNR